MTSLPQIILLSDIQRGISQIFGTDSGTFMLLVKLDVLNAEGAATDGVRLVLVLLVTGSEGKLIDEVESDGALADSHLLRFKI
jgi:hypothetical protein